MRVRAYREDDWGAILDICLLAFTPIHESFETLLGQELFRLVYPDWKLSHERYLRSLTETDRDKLFVAEENGSIVGFIHYELDANRESGKIGLNAVHPAHQRKGVATQMYSYVLNLMRAARINYVHVDTGGDSSHVPAQRAYEKFGFVPIPLLHYYKRL